MAAGKIADTRREQCETRPTNEPWIELGREVRHFMEAIVNSLTVQHCLAGAADAAAEACATCEWTRSWPDSPNR